MALSVLTVLPILLGYGILICVLRRCSLWELRWQRARMQVLSDDIQALCESNHHERIETCLDEVGGLFAASAREILWYDTCVPGRCLRIVERCAGRMSSMSAILFLSVGSLVTAAVLGASGIALPSLYLWEGVHWWIVGAASLATVYSASCYSEIWRARRALHIEIASTLEVLWHRMKYSAR